MRIAMASGKGGTGKTTIATNLAYALASGTNSVVYVDADVEEPNGHLFLPVQNESRTDVTVMVPAVDESRCTGCGVCADLCQFNAIVLLGPAPTVFPSLCHSCAACVDLCPERALFETRRSIGFVRAGKSGKVTFLGGSLAIGESQAPPVTRQLRRALTCNTVAIIDAPPGSSCPVIEAVRGADFVIVVTEPTPFGLHDLRLACDMLRTLGLPFGVVINRSDTGDSQVKEYCRAQRILILLEIPFDRELARTYASGGLAAASDPTMTHNMRRLYAVVREYRSND